MIVSREGMMRSRAHLETWSGTRSWCLMPSVTTNTAITSVLPSLVLTPLPADRGRGPLGLLRWHRRCPSCACARMVPEPSTEQASAALFRFRGSRPSLREPRRILTLQGTAARAAQG